EQSLAINGTCGTTKVHFGDARHFRIPSIIAAPPLKWVIITIYYR
ncbi:unnamed protein product, partial [Callosobruchus maculatus]